MEAGGAEETATADLALAAALGITGQNAVADEHAGAAAPWARRPLRAGQEVVERLLVADEPGSRHRVRRSRIGDATSGEAGPALAS